MPEPAAPQPDALRLVLFGLPGAGKSSLLTAFGRAGEGPPSSAQSPDAEQDLVPYPFDYEPNGRRRPVVVFDSAGGAAAALINDPTAPNPLGREMSHADALVLAVDASAPPERLDAEFAEFDRFLHAMELERGRRAEVAGLPVFLVLTKCDLLARPGETAADWLERIEQRKREVGGRFRDFLAGRDAADGSPPFGRLQVHVWATATGRPELSGHPARPADPYGVAELFRQGLDQAAAFRDRRERSADRLARMTMAAAAGVLVLLAAAGSLVASDLMRRPPSALQLHVEEMRRDEPATAAGRLRGPPEQLRADAAAWRDVAADPGFAALPAGLRDYVQGRLGELDDYVPWMERLEDAPRPRDALTEEDLRTLRANLDGPLAAPRPGWDDTDAGLLRRDLTAEADAMLKAIAVLRAWYQEAYKDGEALWLSAGRTKAGRSWNGWARDAQAWLTATETPPDADPTRPAAPGSPITYADVKEFGSVASARAEWAAVRSRLQRLRDAAAALGLVEGLPGKPALLVVPADGLTLDQAADRFRELRAAYPDYATAFVQDRGLPSAVASDFTDRARANYQLLLEPARALVLARLRAASPGEDRPADAETPQRWAPVREWLKDPKELAGWRGLAVALSRLADPAAPEPVDALASFLDIKTFPMVLNGLTLVVPDEMDVKPAPDGPLTLAHAAGGAAWAGRAFRPAGEGTRVGMQPIRQYRFRAADPDQKLDYAPGDGLFAELPLAGGKTLRWDRSRSHLYQFEALAKEPRLHEGDPPTADARAMEGVRLMPEPENGVPKVPDLMPRVELK